MTRNLQKNIRPRMGISLSPGVYEKYIWVKPEFVPRTDTGAPR